MKKWIILLALVFSCQLVFAGVDFDTTAIFADGDNIDFGDQADFDIVNADWSLSCWLNTTTIGRRCALGKSAEGGLVDWWVLTIDVDATSKLKFEADDGAVKKTLDGDNAFNDGEWHNVVVVHTEGTGYVLYVDTTQEDTDTDNGDCSSSHAFTIGKNIRTNSNDQPWFGQVNEVAIWQGYALTAQDRQNLYNSKVKRMPLQIGAQYLVGYWPLDDLAEGISINGKTFKDLSEKGYNGTGTDTDGDSLSVAETVLSYP